MIQGKMAKITGKRAKSKCDWKGKGKGKGPIGGVNTKQQQPKRGARGKAKANYDEKVRRQMDGGINVIVIYEGSKCHHFWRDIGRFVAGRNGNNGSWGEGVGIR
jgi:hypothetical protein